MVYEGIDFNDFLPAYLQICKNAGKKRVQVRRISDKIEKGGLGASLLKINPLCGY